MDFHRCFSLGDLSIELPLFVAFRGCQKTRLLVLGILQSLAEQPRYDLQPHSPNLCLTDASLSLPESSGSWTNVNVSIPPRTGGTIIGDPNLRKLDSMGRTIAAAVSPA